MPVTIRTLNKRKQDGEKFSMLTAYDATFARLISEAGVDAVLIGDSLGNVIQGRDSTVPVTLDDMVYHTRCVARGNQGSLVLADVPFLGAATLERILEASGALMQAGANMVKLEGGAWLAEAVTVLGYSNGANFAASVMALHPGLIRRAILLRAIPVLVELPQVDLSSAQVLLLTGRDDPLSSEAPRLGQWLQDSGAGVESDVVEAGHEISPADLNAARAWLTR